IAETAVKAPVRVESDQEKSSARGGHGSAAGHINLPICLDGHTDRRTEGIRDRTAHAERGVQTAVAVETGHNRVARVQTERRICRYDNLAVGLEGDIAQLLARAGAECDDSTGTEARVEATITVITHQSGSARAVVVQHAGDNDAAVGLNGECT